MTSVKVERPPRALSRAQLHALFDILTHHQTYREIQSFRDPGTIYAYGFPFVQASSADSSENGSISNTYAARSSAPILHMLLNKTVLTLPPAKALPEDFWRVRIQGIMAQLGTVELSESYDQGAMGTRKTLATAASTLIESVGRGVLGGYPGAGVEGGLASQTYDTSAEDFARAWDDVMRDLVYGNLVDELFTHCAELEDIEGHSAAVRTVVDYIIILLAEFLHNVFVLSPNGRYFTKLVDTAHRLFPYALVQTALGIGNAASMINAMMKALLAKISVGALTNRLGLTSGADDGMNGLQGIISAVFAYDALSFKTAARDIEKASDGPGKARLVAIREHLTRPRAYHEALRQTSEAQGRSAVAVILESFDPQLLVGLDDAQHAQCAQYYAARLSIRDRQELTTVFCRQTPDLFTQALRDIMAAGDPIVRRIHDQIDLKEHLGDCRGFIDDFLKVSKAASTVPDYVDLLRRNRHLLYKWLRRVATDTPDIRDTFRAWAVETIKAFRRPGTDVAASEDASPSPRPGAAGAMTGDLSGLFSSLPDEQKEGILPQIDAHVKYLADLDNVAAARRQRLLDAVYEQPGETKKANGADDDDNTLADGPGHFMARWQALLDETVIGPATASGNVRRGRDVAHVATSGKTDKADKTDKTSRQREPRTRVLAPPDVSLVVAALGRQFDTLLQERRV